MSVEKTTYEFNWVDKGKNAQNHTIANFGRLDNAAHDFDRGFSNVEKNFEGNTNKMRNSMQNLAGEFPVLGRAVGFLTSPLGLLTVGIGLTVGMMHKGIDAAREFDHTFLELNNLNLDKSKDEIDSLKKSVLDLSFEKGLDPNATSKAFFDVQSATGKYGDEVENIVGKVGVFARTMKMDFNEAINGTSKAFDTFGFGVGELDDYMASWAKTVQFGVTTFDQLAKVQTEYAGAAAAAGQGFDEANKVFAMFSKTAKSVDIAATLTKGAFEDLKKLEKINIKVFEKDGSFRQIDDVLGDVNKKFKELSAQDISNLIDQVGGNEGLRGLLKNVQNAGDEVLDTFDEFDNYDFDFDKALENAAGDLDTMSAIIDGKLSSAWIKFGESVKPLLIEIKTWMIDALEWASSFGDVLLNVTNPLAYNAKMQKEMSGSADSFVKTQANQFFDDAFMQMNKEDQARQIDKIKSGLNGIKKRAIVQTPGADYVSSEDEAAWERGIFEFADGMFGQGASPGTENDNSRRISAATMKSVDDALAILNKTTDPTKLKEAFDQLGILSGKSKNDGLNFRSLLEEEEDDKGKGTGTGTSTGLSGIDVKGESIRNVTVNITNLVNEMILNQGSQGENFNELASKITATLVRSVRDAELTLSSE